MKANGNGSGFEQHGAAFLIFQAWTSGYLGANAEQLVFCLDEIRKYGRLGRTKDYWSRKDPITVY